MSSNKWQLGLLDSRRFVTGNWFNSTRSIAHDAFFAPVATTSTYTFNSSAEFPGFVGSGGLSRSQVLNTYTWASTAEFAGFVGSGGLSRTPNFQFTYTSTAEFAGFVGSAGPAFDPFESAYTWASTAEFAGFVGSAFTQYVAGAGQANSIFTWASTAEFAGFVGSAGLSLAPNFARTATTSPEFAGFVGSSGLDFNPLEVSYTATTSPEFAGFVGSAGPSQAPNFALTATTSPEFAGFVGSAATAVTGPSFAYTATTSPEFAGFTGAGSTAYIPFVDPSSLPSGPRRSGGGLLVAGRRRGIIDIISPLPPIDLPPPRVYNAVVGMDGGFSRAAGAADVTFRRQQPNHAAHAIAGIFH